MPSRIFTKHGFTLIELSMVMLLIALLAAIAIPGFRGLYGKYNLELAALQMRQEIRALSQESLRREHPGYQITFDITEASYTVIGPEGRRRVTMPPGIELVQTNFDTNAMSFTATGILSGKGGHVSLRDKVSGKFKWVVVTPVTGRVRISDTQPDDDEEN